MGRGLSQATRVPIVFGAVGEGVTSFNSPPEWTVQDVISFTRGTPGSVLLDPAFVADPDGDTLAFSLFSGSLPAGVTLTSDGHVNYDGTGSGDTSAVVTINADDGVT